MKVIEVKTIKVKRPDQNPDIDVDFESSRRQDVKHYMETKFGFDNVCSIGTFSKLKTKSAIKDFSRAKGLNFQTVNYATSHIKDKIEFDWADIFIHSLESNELKTFVNDNLDICEIIKAPLGQPRSQSIHASAIIICPDKDGDGNPMEIYDWLPVKKIDGSIVSEWEGKYIDRAGYLKEDILGLAQLDKFKNILMLIKQNRDLEINLNEIPVDDDSVFEHFQKGWNEDVFQFGTIGLKNYSLSVKPKTIEDLTVMNALYRPGPMASDAHNSFVAMRNKKKKSEIDHGMYEIVKNTQGLYIYQEQIMQAMVVGGLTLIESDEVRTHMKKFNKVALAAFMDKFINGYSKVCREWDSDLTAKTAKDYATKVWDKLNAFSSYGFNKSHSLAYSIIGYQSQWLKVHFPLEFWAASLNFSKTEEIPMKISELRTSACGVKVSAPDINKSDTYFTTSTEENKIFWSLTKIKFVGDVAVHNIIQERQNGQFFSLEDFISRINKSKVNKKVITNLITVGAFDLISSENIPSDKQGQSKYRYLIMERFFELRREPMPEEIYNDPNRNKNWFWKQKQKELTGFGDINYKTLVKRVWPKPELVDTQFLDGEQINKLEVREKSERQTIVAGRIQNLKVRPAKNGDYAVIYVESNNSIVMLQLWNDTWSNKNIKTKLLDLEASKNIFAFSGSLRGDSWKNKNVIFGNQKTKIIEL